MSKRWTLPGTRLVSPSLAPSLVRSVERRRTGVDRRRTVEIATRASTAAEGDPMFVDLGTVFPRRALSWGRLVGLCRTDAAWCFPVALVFCLRRVVGEELTTNVGV